MSVYLISINLLNIAPLQRHQQIAEELVHAALARGSMDNVTCIVVKLTGYISKQLLKENCENRSDNVGFDPLSLVNPNSSKTHFSNAISPLISPTTVNMMHGQQTQVTILCIIFISFTSISHVFLAEYMLT
jgi:hypothetical protein